MNLFPVFDSIVDSCCQNIYISISYNEIKLYVEQQRKEENDEVRANIDMMKMMQARETDEAKMEQNDQHQKLRAAVSMAKSGISSIDKQRSATKKVN